MGIFFGVAKTGKILILNHASWRRAGKGTDIVEVMTRYCMLLSIILAFSSLAIIVIRVVDTTSEMMENEVRMRKWLDKILRNHNFDTFELRFPDYDKNGGYAGEMEFADVIAEKNGKKEIIPLIIKKNKESEVLLNTLNLREIYTNEVKLYSIILPQFIKFAEEKNATPFDAIPQCYGTINEQDQYVIILKNLKPEGYKIHTLEEYFDSSHIKLVLEAYGEWHGFCLALRDQKPELFCSLGTKQKNNKLLQLIGNTTKHEIEDTIELFQRENKSHVIENLKKLKENHDELIENTINNKNEDFVVIKHGDSWNNNFLFHYDEEQKKPDKVVIIDWQLSFFSSPLVDVTNVIFGCCSRKEIEHVDELLEFYYTSLSRKLKELGCDPDKLFPWDACLKSFERYAPLAIAVIPVHMRMKYKVEPDAGFDIESAIQKELFSGCHGEGIRDPEKYLEEIYATFEYCIERKWI